ncbi:MAG TPA: hypothetical protein VF326_13320 [Anaerolineaceae bacterium]
MVTHEKIEEWICEVEERPSSAPVIIRYIANRLSELTRRNQELLADNIALRTDKKVDDYENRISNLEYQVGLLKRQLSEPGLIDSSSPMIAQHESAILFVYNSKGKILKAVIPVSTLESGKAVAQFITGENWIDADTPMFVVVNSREELLLIYDSGRTMTLNVDDIPANDATQLDWQHAYLQEPRSGEALVAIMPVAKMGLFDYALQISRRGFVKKIMEGSFESFIANNFIGAGIKLTPDKPFGLIFAKKEDNLVLVSREGFLLSMDVGRLPFAVEEILQLSTNDHLEAIFVVSKSTPTEVKSSFLVMTEGGKVINRNLSWIEPVSSFRTRGQSLFSKEKRTSGVRVVGGGLAQDDDWGFALAISGQITCHPIKELFSTGALPNPLTGLVGFSLLKK